MPLISHQNWNEFANALMGTTLGQRICMKLEGSNCYATCCAGLAAMNAVAVNMSLPVCADANNATQEERDEVNAIIAQYPSYGIEPLPPA